MTVPQSWLAFAVANFVWSTAANTVPFNVVPSVNVIFIATLLRGIIREESFAPI